MTHVSQFELITDRPMPDFSKSARSTYPFDLVAVGQAFKAGPDDKKLRGRLYSAIHARKDKHPSEAWKLEVDADGRLCVWRAA